MANMTFATLENIAEMVGHLDGLTLRVRRDGSGKNTRYTMVPSTIPLASESPTDQPGEIAARIRQLCDKHSIEPKKELAAFLDNEDPSVRASSALDQLLAFEQHLLMLTATTPDQDQAAAAETNDPSLYF